MEIPKSNNPFQTQSGGGNTKRKIDQIWCPKTDIKLFSRQQFIQISLINTFNQQTMTEMLLLLSVSHIYLVQPHPSFTKFLSLHIHVRRKKTILWICVSFLKANKVKVHRNAYVCELHRWEMSMKRFAVTTDQCMPSKSY